MDRYKSRFHESALSSPGARTTINSISDEISELILQSMSYNSGDMDEVIDSCSEDLLTAVGAGIARGFGKSGIRATLELKKQLKRML